MDRYIAKFVLISHLGSINDLCYIQNGAVTSHVIKRSRCIIRCYKKAIYVPNTCLQVTHDFQMEEL